MQGPIITKLSKVAINQSAVYSQDHPKEHLLIWNSETTQNLYLSNYQTETAIFLATKLEKPIMACSYLKFLKNLLGFKLLASNTAIMKVFI